VGSTLTANGATKLGSTLSVATAATLKSTLSVAGTLTASGATKLTSTLSVGSTLTANGATKLGSTLSVSSSFNADGATRLKSTLSVTNAVTFASTLSVGGKAYFNANDGVRLGNRGLYISGNTVYAYNRMRRRLDETVTNSMNSMQKTFHGKIHEANIIDPEYEERKKKDEDTEEKEACMHVQDGESYDSISTEKQVIPCAIIPLRDDVRAIKEMLPKVVETVEEALDKTIEASDAKHQEAEEAQKKLTDLAAAADERFKALEETQKAIIVALKAIDVEIQKLTQEHAIPKEQRKVLFHKDKDKR
jgi:hypothetical protein